MSHFPSKPIHHSSYISLVVYIVKDAKMNVMME